MIKCFLFKFDHYIKGGLFMLLMIIFALISLFGAYGTFTSLKNKNVLGIAFGLGSFLVFGWFTIMTVLNNGFPAAH